MSHVNNSPEWPCTSEVLELAGHVSGCDVVRGVSRVWRRPWRQQERSASPDTLDVFKAVRKEASDCGVSCSDLLPLCFIICWVITSHSWSMWWFHVAHVMVYSNITFPVADVALVKGHYSHLFSK